MRSLITKFILMLMIFPLGVSSVSGLSSNTVLTFGDVLILYFTDLFPNNNREIQEVIVKYSGISDKSTLRTALQKAIYYGMIPNISAELHPDTPMTDRALARLLEKDFGLIIKADSSPLTFWDYENIMKKLRSSYAYKLIQSLNATETVPTTLVPTEFSSASRVPTADNFYVLESVYSILQDNYLHAEGLNEKDLIYGATEGIVNELGDQYTVFFRPDASADFHNSLDGTIVGIGIVLDIDSQGYLSITDVVFRSPAEKAGIQAKDRIIQINGVTVDTKNGIADDILNIRGKEGTSVDLVIQSGKDTRNITVIRQKIQLQLVTTEVKETAFVITYNEVGFGTDALMKTALQSFISSGKERLILDLRNNPGGSLFETKNILNNFIPKGQPTMILRYPRSENITYATGDTLADWTEYEIIILTNHDTASAAEVIASTLREYFPKNVVLLGETTYGKGTVQELVGFDDNSLLKYTVAEWMTPKQKISVHGIGIKPDKVVPFDAKVWKSKKIDTQMMTAINYTF